MKTLKKTKQSIFIIASLLIMVVILSGCAQNIDVQQCLTGKAYGFWSGLWHGIIAPIDFIVSLFNHKITVYAQNNNGSWYAFGFILGSGGWGFLGAHRAAASASKKKRAKQVCDETAGEE